MPGYEPRSPTGSSTEIRTQSLPAQGLDLLREPNFAIEPCYYILPYRNTQRASVTLSRTSHAFVIVRSGVEPVFWCVEAVGVEPTQPKRVIYSDLFSPMKSVLPCNCRTHPNHIRPVAPGSTTKTNRDKMGDSLSETIFSWHHLLR